MFELRYVSYFQAVEVHQLVRSTSCEDSGLVYAHLDTIQLRVASYVTTDIIRIHIIWAR